MEEDIESWWSDRSPQHVCQQFWFSLTLLCHFSIFSIWANQGGLHNSPRAPVITHYRCHYKDFLFTPPEPHFFTPKLLRHDPQERLHHSLWHVTIYHLECHTGTSAVGQTPIWPGAGGKVWKTDWSGWRNDQNGRLDRSRARGTEKHLNAD